MKMTARMEGNHANHYTTRHILSASSEDKLNTTLAGHNRKEALNIEEMKEMLF